MLCSRHYFGFFILLITLSGQISGFPVDNSPSDGVFSDDFENGSLAEGYYHDDDPGTQDLHHVLVQDQNVPVGELLKDIKGWSKENYIKQMGSEPTDEELEDYMYDMITFLL